MSYRALLLGSLMSCLPLVAQTQSPQTRWDSLARNLLKELVEIKTAESDGSTLRAAEAMAARLKSAGFPAADISVI
jgi:hypothetical protein